MIQAGIKLMSPALLIKTLQTNLTKLIDTLCFK